MSLHELPIFQMEVLRSRGESDVWGVGGCGAQSWIQSNTLSVFVNTYCVIHYKATTMTGSFKKNQCGPASWLLELCE